MTADHLTGDKHAAGDRTNPRPVMLDIGEVAAMLNVSVRTVRRLVDSGKCPQPVRLGRALRWPRQATETWVASGCPRARTLRAGGAR